jgi:hypothetical protein
VLSPFLPPPAERDRRPDVEPDYDEGDLWK